MDLYRRHGPAPSGVGLQAYGQKDPKVEYKMAAYEMFDEMTASIQQDTLRLLYQRQNRTEGGTGAGGSGHRNQQG